MTEKAFPGTSFSPKNWREKDLTEEKENNMSMNNEKFNEDPMNDIFNYDSKHLDDNGQLIAILKNLNLRIQDLEYQVEECERCIDDLKREIEKDRNYFENRIS